MPSGTPSTRRSGRRSNATGGRSRTIRCSSPSPITELERALGQYILYRTALRRREPDRTMVLAVPRIAYDSLLESELGRAAREDVGLVAMVFDPQQEAVWKWLR